jgi:amidohydrolase
MNPEAVYKRIDDLADQFKSQQIEIFRWLHQHPELAYQEFQTIWRNSQEWRSPTQ